MYSSVVSTQTFVYSGMDCKMYASIQSSFWLHVSVCACQKRCLTAHIGKTWPAVTMASHRKWCTSFWSRSRSPWQFSLSFCVATSFFKRQTSSWTMAKSRQKELRNLRSSVHFNLLVLGLFEGCEWAQESESELAYTQNHHCLKGAMCEIFCVFPRSSNTDTLGFPSPQILMLSQPKASGFDDLGMRLCNHICYTLHL